MGEAMSDVSIMLILVALLGFFGAWLFDIYWIRRKR
jgi:hypothetical protein